MIPNIYLTPDGVWVCVDPSILPTLTGHYQDVRQVLFWVQHEQRVVAALPPETNETEEKDRYKVPSKVLLGFWKVTVSVPRVPLAGVGYNGSPPYSLDHMEARLIAYMVELLAWSEDEPYPLISLPSHFRIGG